MDRSLDDIIADRPRGPRRPERRPEQRPPPARAPRRDDYPRDGVKKNRRDDRANIDTDWVHDRYEDERFERRRRDSPEYGDRDPRPRGGRADDRSVPGTKLRVENLHYDLTESDINELFNRIGPIVSARLLYDRSDRSQGVAFVTYEDSRDARRAVEEFNGANANGQPIRITVIPSGPPRGGNGGSLFERVEKPVRSLFERIDGGERDGDDRRGPRGRSYSPRRGANGNDYGRRRSQSPRRRGGPRERGRRPGARREDSGRTARKPRTDEAGRPLVGGRPKKTAEELDAEMNDYFGSSEAKNETAQAATTQAAPAPADDDIDMIS